MFNDGSDPEDLLIDNPLLGSSGLNDVVRATTDEDTGSISGLSVAGRSVAPQAPPIPSNILAKWTYGSVTATAAAASDFTYHTTLTVEYAATRFRIALMNMNATTCTVGPAIISVSNAVGADLTFGVTTGQGRVTPSTGTWVAITWAAASTVTLAARVSATVPSITWSDWIDIATIPRTDGGTLPVVMIRYLIPSSGSTNAYNIGGIGQVHGQAVASKANSGALASTWTKGRLNQVVRYSGDGITTPANFQPTTDLGYCMVHGMEYASKRPGYTLLVNGDSVAAGAVDSSNGNFGNGVIWQALNLFRSSYPNIPIEMANIGVSGSTSDTFVVRLNSYTTAAGHYDLAYFQVGSPNDGTPTQIVIDTGLRRFAQAVDVFKTAKVPYLTSSPCVNTALGWNAAADAFRLQQRTEILEYPNSGVQAVDFEVLSDGATPARFAAAYTTDGTHPNEAGHAVLAVPMAAALARMLGT
jgi:lysophospholipase L1-like esterase